MADVIELVIDEMAFEVIGLSMLMDGVELMDAGLVVLMDSRYGDMYVELLEEIIKVEGNVYRIVDGYQFRFGFWVIMFCL